MADWKDLMFVRRLCRRVQDRTISPQHGARRPGRRRRRVVGLVGQAIGQKWLVVAAAGVREVGDRGERAAERLALPCGTSRPARLPLLKPPGLLVSNTNSNTYFSKLLLIYLFTTLHS